MASCAGQTEVIADYGQRVYEYGISFQWEREGDLVLTVTAPVEAAGITARVSGEQTSLEYDGVRLETGPLNEDGLSPIDAIPPCCEPCGRISSPNAGWRSWERPTRCCLCCGLPENTAGVGEEITLWLHPETHALLRGEVSQDGFTVIQCTFTEFTAG